MVHVISLAAIDTEVTIIYNIRIPYIIIVRAKLEIIEAILMCFE